MRRLFGSGRSVITVAAAAAAVVVAAGVSYAATGGFVGNAQSAAAKRVYACVVPPFNTLNLSSAGATCPRGQRKVSWSASGPRGPRGPGGLRGRLGAVGRQGATGPQAATGPQGLNGETGAQGPQGLTGTQGLKGDSGTTGPAGAPGAPGTLSSAYVDAYNSASFLISPGARFRFDTVQVASGITATGPFSFTIDTTGTYVVSFTAAAQGPVRLRVNAAGVGPQLDLTSCGVGTLCSFSRIVSVNAGDVIDVVNAGGATEHDETGTGITIMRIA
jgi:hypothetical protein